MMYPLVSIITVNYNQSALTLELLASLAQISYPSVEIIVVDNGSSESPKALIQRAYPQVIVIESSENLGFAGGNNLGISISKGNFCLFLNNDTEVEPSFLEPLVNAMKQTSQMGIAAAKLRYFEAKETLQFAGSTPMHPWKIQSFAYGFGEKDEGQWDYFQETALAHGAAMLVRSSVIKEVGPMPLAYFLYYEEIDWCEQIKKAGCTIFFVPDSLVWHKESRSIGKKSPLQIYYKSRNRLLFARRWRKGVLLYLSISYLLVVLLKDAIKYVFLGNFNAALQVFRALIWHVMYKEKTTSPVASE